MDLILSNAADILLILATLGAGTFCLILSRRLTRLSRIDNGLGGAIAVLSAQVDDMSKALAETRSGSEGSATRLEELNAEAQRLLEELELTMSACHDLAPPEDARPTEAKLEAWDIEKLGLINILLKPNIMNDLKPLEISMIFYSLSRNMTFRHAYINNNNDKYHDFFDKMFEKIMMYKDRLS